MPTLTKPPSGVRIGCAVFSWPVAAPVHSKRRSVDRSAPLITKLPRRVSVSASLVPSASRTVLTEALSVGAAKMSSKSERTSSSGLVGRRRGVPNSAKSCSPLRSPSKASERTKRFEKRGTPSPLSLILVIIAYPSNRWYRRSSPTSKAPGPLRKSVPRSHGGKAPSRSSSGASLNSSEMERL